MEMPRTMQAAVFQAGGSVVLREVPVPKREPGGVLLRVRACGICGSDLHVLLGDWPMRPHQVGHEIAAEVIGADAASGLRPGDHVSVEPIVSCGHCRYCASGNYVHCPSRRMIGLELPGGYAEYLHAPAAQMLHRLPETLPWDIAALTEPVAVAVHALRLAGLAPRMRVAVVGGGSIGLLVLGAALAMGARHVGILVKYEHQAALARRLGATSVGFASEDRATQRLLDELGGEVDIAVEAVGGRGSVAQQALELVRPMGTVVIAGGFPSPVLLDLRRLQAREIRLVGAHCYSADLHQQREFMLAVDLLVDRSIDAEALITHRVSLEQAPAAFAAALDKRTGAVKAVILP